jgi:hypothetical protein
MLRKFELLASFCEGVLSGLATILLFSQYPYSTVAALIVAHVVLSRLFGTHWWSLFGGFLAGVLIEFISRGTSDAIQVLYVSIVGVAALQISIVVIAFLARDALDPESSVSQNFLFALIGCLLFYAWQTQTCGIPAIRSIPDELNGSIIRLDRCLVQRALTNSALIQPIVLQPSQLSWWFMESVFATMVHFVHASPVGMVALLAAMRQVAFKRHSSYTRKIHDQAKHYIRQVQRLIEQFMRGVGVFLVLYGGLSVLKMASSLFGLPDVLTDGATLTLSMEHLYFNNWGVAGMRLIGILILCWLIAFVLHRTRH